jgi:apolipoprotein N-acyltransferase
MLRRIWRAVALPRAEWRDNRTAFFLCVFGGFLGMFLFSVGHMAWLAHIALVPYLIALSRLRGRALVYGNFIFGFIWYYTTLFWANTLIVFHPLIPIGIPVAALIQSVYLLLFSFPAAYVLRRVRAAFQPLLIATLWVALEYVHSLTDLALPWNFLAHTQIRGDGTTAVAQLADILGVYGVSWLPALSNAVFAAGSELRKAHPHRRRRLECSAHRSPAHRRVADCSRPRLVARIRIRHHARPLVATHGVG